ncbi:MAG: sensor histidine kinase [Crocinitomicaceae bacterium]
MEKTDSIIPLYWIIGSLVVFLIILGFVVFILKAIVNRIKNEEQKKADLKTKHHQEMLKNSIDIQERERSRIASDIHDGLIAKLYQLRLMNENKGLDENMDTCITMARSISHDLSPPLIADMNINELCYDFLQPFQTEFDIHFASTNRSTTALSFDEKLHLYRIFQEMIINIKKHANSSSIFIYTRLTNQYFALKVEDHGIGLINQQNGLGLKNVNLRAKQLKAKFKFKNKATGGTTFLITFNRK